MIDQAAPAGPGAPNASHVRPCMAARPFALDEVLALADVLLGPT